EKVVVPVEVGEPTSSPEECRVSPAGGVPEKRYGGVPFFARNVVVKKLLMKLFEPAPMSQVPLVQAKNCVSKASGAGVVPAGCVPVPVSVAVCGLFGALSVRVNVAVRVPACWGEKVNDMLQLPPAGSVTPEHWSSTWVKSSEWVCALLTNRFA